MPTQGFSTGKDITLATITPKGALTMGGIASFESRQITSSLDAKLITGDNIYSEIETGWEGTIELYRTGPAVDAYFAASAESYYAGADPGVSTITQTINEIGGGVSQFRYEGVVYKYAEAGTWKGDAQVMQRMTFRATLRRQVQ